MPLNDNFIEWAINNPELAQKYYPEMMERIASRISSTEPYLTASIIESTPRHFTVWKKEANNHFGTTRKKLIEGYIRLIEFILYEFLPPSEIEQEAIQKVKQELSEQNSYWKYEIDNNFDPSHTNYSIEEMYDKISRFPTSFPNELSYFQKDLLSRYLNNRFQENWNNLRKLSNNSILKKSKELDEKWSVTHRKCIHILNLINKVSPILYSSNLRILSSVEFLYSNLNKGDFFLSKIVTNSFTDDRFGSIEELVETIHRLGNIESKNQINDWNKLFTTFPNSKQESIQEKLLECKNNFIKPSYDSFPDDEIILERGLLTQYFYKLTDVIPYLYIDATELYNQLIKRLSLLKKIEFLKELETIHVPISIQKVPESVKFIIKPTMDEETATTIYNILEKHFDPEHKSDLEYILKTGSNSPQKLVFKSTVKRLADTFKQLIEHHFITGCEKQDLQTWIVNNFMNLVGKEPVQLKYDTVKNTISRHTTPCKNPLIEIRDGKIYKVDKPIKKKVNKY